MGRKNDHPVKAVLEARGLKQRWICKQVGLERLTEARLSGILHGDLVATDEEKKAIAKVLRMSVRQLFPEPVAA